MKMFHNALNLTISLMALGIGGFIFLLSSLVELIQKDIHKKSGYELYLYSYTVKSKGFCGRSFLLIRTRLT